jgi:hypothetical protein
MASREIPVIQPRPLCDTLPKAIAAFIAADWTDRSLMLVPAWAQTYRCQLADVRSEWERQMSVKSQLPDNTCQIPEGK